MVHVKGGLDALSAEAQTPDLFRERLVSSLLGGDERCLAIPVSRAAADDHLQGERAQLLTVQAEGGSLPVLADFLRRTAWCALGISGPNRTEIRFLSRVLAGVRRHQVLVTGGSTTRPEGELPWPKRVLLWTETDSSTKARTIASELYRLAP